jgi:hypothetical protein
MTPFRTRTRLAWLLAALASPALAQTDFSFMFEPPEPRWTVSVGTRYHGGGAGVDFSGLGNIPLRAADLTTGRFYDNGFVNLDQARLNEIDADGNQTSTPGGRYQIFSAPAEDGSTVLVGDFVSYTAGYTRNWNYGNASQVTSDGRIGMDLFGASSGLGTAAAKSDGSAGFDLALSRRIGKRTRNFEWGVTLGFGLSQLKADAQGSVTADLRRLTDFYRVRGDTIPDAPYGAPSFTDILTPGGEVISPGGFETTIPLTQVPVERIDVLLPGGAVIDGRWQIKGAYFLGRLGPHMRWHLNERMAFSLSAGLAVAYVGTTFTSEESLTPPESNNPISNTEEGEADKVVTGFYFTGNAEYWLRPNTGFYLGASYESLGKFNQTLNGRSAAIDVGEGSTVRTGLMLRF